MIRDPSDGSVKESAELRNHATGRPTSAENWGLKSLDKAPRKPKPAPTKEELSAHYRAFNLGFRPKTIDEGT